MSSNESNLHRRRFLKMSSGLVLTPALGAGLSAFSGSASAADTNSVTVGTWGGDYQNLLESQIATPLLKPQHLDVSFLTGDAVSRMTKLRAERTARRPSMDVACLSDTDMATMNESGLLTTPDLSQIKNAGNVFPSFLNAYSLPHIYSGLVIVYNTNFIKSPPDSFTAAMDPKFKGRVGFSDIIFNYCGMFCALSSGKSASDMKAGTDFLRQLKKNAPRVYPSNEAVAAALKSGEIWMTCMWKARALQWQQGGVPVDFAFDKAGAIPVVFQAAIPKNNHAPANGYRFIDAMLDPKAQIGFAEKMGYAPTIRNAGLPPALQAKVGFTDAQVEKFQKLDYAKLTSEKEAFLQYWNTDFKVGL